jgi:hypothetical protein
MMQGVVNLRNEATLTVVVGNSNRKLQAINTVIDIGNLALRVAERSSDGS